MTEYTLLAEKLDVVHQQQQDMSKAMTAMLESQARRDAHMEVMAESLKQLADVGLHQVRLEGELAEARKDIDILYQNQKDARERGLPICNERATKIEYIEKDMNQGFKGVRERLGKMESRLWKTALIVAGIASSVGYMSSYLGK